MDRVEKDLENLREAQEGLQEQLHEIRRLHADESNTQRMRHEANAEKLKRMEKYLFDGNGEPALQIQVTQMATTLKGLDRWVTAQSALEVQIAQIATSLKGLGRWVESLADKLDGTATAAQDTKSQLLAYAQGFGWLLAIAAVLYDIFLRH